LIKSYVFNSNISPKPQTFPITLFDIGNRCLNILHAKLRNNCSSLNPDLYRVNLTASPTCRCGFYRENTDHYLLHCNLYNEIRDDMFAEFEHLNLEPTLQSLLNGSDQISENENKNKIVFLTTNLYKKF